MAVYQCKVCGGNIVATEGATIGTCENCGRTSTLPNVYDEQRTALYNRGNHFRIKGEYDRALATFEQLIGQDATDAEAHWNAALCRFGIEYVEDPDTHKYIATCHRTTYDSILDDVDYLDAVKYADPVAREIYIREAQYIDGVQKGIIAISKNEEPYDIFICYKESTDGGSRTKDSVYAQDLYDRLVKEGYRVFFARITLEGKLGVQYEPYIFSALNSAKVMLVVCTSTDNVNSPWVKNEWRRYLAMAKKDDSKVLIPCYRDMNPYDLPDELAIIQGQDMGKIGFEQDLLRGIAKIIKKDEPKTVTRQEAATATVSSLLKRADMFLSDCNWDSARQYYDRVLDINPECAEAYAGKICVQINSPSVYMMGEIYYNSLRRELTPTNPQELTLTLCNWPDFKRAKEYASSDFSVALDAQVETAHKKLQEHISGNISALHTLLSSCEKELTVKNQKFKTEKTKAEQISCNINTARAGLDDIKRRVGKAYSVAYAIVFVAVILFCIIGISVAPDPSFGSNLFGVIIWCIIGFLVASVIGYISQKIIETGKSKYQKMLSENETKLNRQKETVTKVSNELMETEKSKESLIDSLAARERELNLITALTK